MYQPASLILLAVILALALTALVLLKVAKAQRRERQLFAKSNYNKKRPWWADK